MTHTAVAVAYDYVEVAKAFLAKGADPEVALANEYSNYPKQSWDQWMTWVT